MVKCLYDDAKSCVGIIELFELLQHFHKCSGLKVNNGKTEILNLTDPQNRPPNIPAKWVDSEFNILGIKFSTNPEQLSTLNFANRIKVFFEFEWGFYALSASKAIFRARRYNCITYSVRWRYSNRIKVSPTELKKLPSKCGRGEALLWQEPTEEKPRNCPFFYTQDKILKFIQEVQDLILKFVWDNKPAKVKNQVM